jgi:RES domain-containing protein
MSGLPANAFAALLFLAKAGGFPALYCCCSLPVAIAIARLKLRRSGLELANLSPNVLPAVSEILWRGDVADVTSIDGVKDAGFPADYPATTPIAETQAAAARWQAEGCEGVVCRSDALWRQGESAWAGSHEPWGEVAVFVRNAANQPIQGHRYTDVRWLEAHLTK